jgi:DNA-binding GntR family transcriptional regulator
MSIAVVLDKNLPLPLYHQLQAVLRAEIEFGKWRADEQLPSETKLAERFGVSKVTVRQALQELAEFGYICREQGRGTFVARRKFDEGPRELTSFTEEMRRHNLIATSRILAQDVVEADDRVAAALALPPKSAVFVLKRLRLGSEGPASDLLGIPVGSPVFAVERVTLLPNERPFEFVQSIVRGDRYAIVLDLVKHGFEQRTLALRTGEPKRTD